MTRRKSQQPGSQPITKHLGRYEIIKEIGRGAMGTVFQARDPKIDRVVAIKTISVAGQSRADEEEFRQRFFFEAQAAGAISHPGIVTIYDVGEDEAKKTTFIVMEYVEGQTLGELAEGERLPLETALDLTKQVAETLGYAHSRNIVHRDIKPANIIVTSEGRAKITDFGIAKLQTAQLTQPGQVLGTPAYMSPEQVTGGAVDGRSDIFSLGVILYWLLTGDKPFPGGTTSAITYKIVYQDPIPPSQLNRSLSPDHDYVVRRALAKDQGKRYQRGQEFAEDLEDLRVGRPVRSRGNIVTSTAVEETVVIRRPKPAQGGRLGAAFLAISFNLLLLDAGIETYLRGWPTSRVVGIIVASCFALTVLLWKKMGWLAKAGFASLVLLGLLAFAAWQWDSTGEEIVLFGQASSALLSAVTGVGIAFAGIVLVRLRLLRLVGRLAVVLLTAYAVTAFVNGVVSGQPYPDLYHGASLWTSLPFLLQGAIVGSFVLLPGALVSLAFSRLLGVRRTNTGRWFYSLLFLCLILTMSVGGYKAPRTSALVFPFGRGSIEAFIASEDATETIAVTRPTGQIRKNAKRIYLVLEGRNTGPISVEATWLAVKVEGSEPNQKLGSSRLSLESGQRKTVSLSAPRGGFPPGDYRAQISVNGGPPQSLSFRVVSIPPTSLISILPRL